MARSARPGTGSRSRPARRRSCGCVCGQRAPAGTRLSRWARSSRGWSKQLYHYNVGRWLDGDPGQPVPPDSRQGSRNTRGRGFDAFDVMSMPDKWEYPWFAAWDLAFHCVALAHVDPAFAKDQLLLVCREWFQHPNGALPAYEWDFGDDLTIEYPTGSGRSHTLDEVAADLWDRLVSIFLIGPDGRRPCFGGVERLQRDPNWKDNLMFHEYFHGDNAAGLGAAHQTGWTGLVADAIRRRHRAFRSIEDVLLGLDEQA